MTQVVKAQTSQARRPRQLSPGTPQRGRADRLSEGVGEDQPVLAVGKARGQSLLYLPDPVLAERVHRRSREGHRTSAAVALGLAEDKALPRKPLAGLPNVKRAGVQVDVLPAQAKELAQA